MNKLFIILIILVAALIIIFTWASWVDKNPSDVGKNNAGSIEITDADWQQGNREAKLILVEYGDFQCPACGAYHPMLDALMSEFGDNLMFVYRHFPLTSIHPNALPAAQATEAAGKQEQFWQMHDVLFENQPEWSNTRDALKVFTGYAQNSGLDVEQFRNDYNSQSVKAKINKDSTSARKLGVNSTPSFFLLKRISSGITSEKLQNPRSLEEFRALIKNALAEVEVSAENIEVQKPEPIGPQPPTKFDETTE
jgi:protein-disulfide isomerase